MEIESGTRVATPMKHNAFSGKCKCAPPSCTRIIVALWCGLAVGGIVVWLLHGSWGEVKDVVKDEQCVPTNISVDARPNEVFLDQPTTLLGNAARILGALAVPEEDTIVMYASDHRTMWTSLHGNLSVEEVKAGAKADHWCRFDDGSLQPIIKEGASMKYETVRLWRCAVRNHTIFQNSCVQVEIVDGTGHDAKSLGSMQACPATAAGTSSNQKKHQLAMCVRPVFEPEVSEELPSNRPQSAFSILPPLLEYQARHGVDHVLVYVAMNGFLPGHMEALSSILKPYGSFVTLLYVPADISDPNSMQYMTITDCVWRLRHRAEWVGPQFDMDEYPLPARAPSNENAHARNPSFANGFSLSKHLERYEKTDINSVTLPMLKFVQPGRGLYISSFYSKEEQEDGACWKTFVRPTFVQVMFVHWPSRFADQTKNVVVEDMRYNHYHNDSDYKGRWKVDTSLELEANVISACLQTRYGRPLDVFVEQTLLKHAPRQKTALRFLAQAFPRQYTFRAPCTCTVVAGHLIVEDAPE